LSHEAGHGQLDHARVRERVGQARSGGPPAVRGVVVNDPVHPPRGGVGLAGHDLLDEFGERRDACRVGAMPDHVGAVDVVGGEVGQGAVSAKDRHQDRSARPGISSVGMDEFA
jgi:hypothetical protein